MAEFFTFTFSEELNHDIVRISRVLSQFLGSVARVRRILKIGVWSQIEVKILYHLQRRYVFLLVRLQQRKLCKSSDYAIIHIRFVGWLGIRLKEVESCEDQVDTLASKSNFKAVFARGFEVQEVCYALAITKK